MAVDLSSNAVAGPSTQLSVKNTPGRPKLSVAEKESNKAERAARKSIVAPPLKPVIPPTETVAPIPPPIILPPIPPFAVLRREVYDLSTDIIHKHISPLSKPVLIPGYETAFQPAFDVPGDSYPHNSENLGLVRWVPAADQSTEPFKMGLVKGKAYRKWHRLCGMRPCIRESLDQALFSILLADDSLDTRSILVIVANQLVSLASSSIGSLHPLLPKMA